MSAHNPLLGLTPEQLETFEKMKHEFAAHSSEFGAEELAWCDDACMLRYLRGYQFIIADALNALYVSLKWRAEYKPQHIKFEEVATQASYRAFYYAGQDLKNQPTLVLHAGRMLQSPGTNDEKMKYAIYVLEEACRNMDASSGVEKWMVLMNLKGNWFSSLDRTLVRKWIDLFGNHYPERLSVSFIVDAGMLFEGFWAIVSPFLHPITRAKIQWASGDADKKKKFFETFFVVSKLDACFGGEVVDEVTQEELKKEKKGWFW